MANTTFNGPVRSENGFEVIETNSTTGAKTTYLDANNVTSVSTTASQKGAGVLMRTDASSQAFQLQTYTASISIGAAATSGNEAAIGMPANFMPMMCSVTVTAASTNGINLVDVGVQADTDDYIDGAALSLGTTTSSGWYWCYFRTNILWYINCNYFKLSVINFRFYYATF